jgi:mannitol-1-/sugar-/sorbitol-6-/2-deoxyglucose-6-phosphatase
VRVISRRPIPLAAVIFDMDGVIVDSEPFWRRVEAECFDELGADIRSFLGHGLTMGLRVDQAIHFLVAASELEGVDEAALVEKVVAGIVEAIYDDAELMPGVIAALELFAGAGVGVALASGSTPPVIGAVMEKFSLMERFDVICSAADDLIGKPNPAIFLRAAASLEAEPAETLVIEDSLNGVIAAKAAMMRCIAVPHPDDAGDPRFSIADLLLGSLDELPAHASEIGLVPAEGVLGLP